MTVPIQSHAAATTLNFYRNRGDDGTVNLNRLNSNITSPIGLFCCMVPDATSLNINGAYEMQRICVNIGKFMFIIVFLKYYILTGVHYSECRNHCYI